MAFRFKQFSVEDANCPMKVGTDSVLLGAWAKFDDCRQILDIGTGCGLIALMAAQQSQADIVAIDIDPKAIETAESNFKSSQWTDRLIAQCICLLEFSNTFTSQAFDHIITNPPFFNNSLKAPIAERSNARHTDLLSFEMLASATNRLLKPEGKFSLILPIKEGRLFAEIAKANHLYLTTSLIIVPKTGKPANRMLMQFEKSVKPAFTDELLIREANGEYTTAYKKLTGDFYLNF